MKKYPECLKVIPILLAVRKTEIYCQDETGAVNYNFAEINQPVAQYKYFMRATGLFELLANHLISNLYDYRRKNRGGHQMENLVENFLKAAAKIFAIETARSYKKIAEDAEKFSGFEFIWITDGKGWRSARQNLRETFLVLQNLYNIKDLEDGKFLELFK